MKMLRTAIAAALLLVCIPAFAQQTPNHSIPIGRGVGVTGFGAAAPGTAGQPLVSNGASTDPSFQQVPNAGLATMLANTTKCNATSGVAVPTDCDAATMRSNTAVPGLATNNSYSGVNNFNGGVFFGSGRPWIDVRSGANSCAAALGNNSNDDTTAIQCQLTFAGASGNTASVVFLPCGNYKVTAQINIPANVFLVGQGLGCSEINASAGNFQIIHFTGNYSGMVGVFVLGNATSGATQTAVQIQSGAVGVQIRDSYIWGGLSALQVVGVDCYLQNNFIGAAPAAGAISLYLHAGVCKIIGNKIDPPSGGGTGSFGIVIDNISSGGVGVVENLFVGNDVSGYTTAVSIDDSPDASGRTVYTTFADNVFGSGISIISAKGTTISGGELAGSINISAAGGPVAVTGVLGQAPLTASKALCSANINIDCSMTVATLPVCGSGTRGATAFVTDQATAIAYHGAVTGSGAFKQQVVCDGTSWYQD